LKVFILEIFIDGSEIVGTDQSAVCRAPRQHLSTGHPMTLAGLFRKNLEYKSITRTDILPFPCTLSVISVCIVKYL